MNTQRRSSVPQAILRDTRSGESGVAAIRENPPEEQGAENESLSGGLAESSTPRVASTHDSFLRRLREGDPTAYESLVRDNGPRLLAVARRYLSSEPDCEEAVSDAFASAFKAIDRFEGASTLSTWLHRIIINVCLMRLRSERARRTVSVEELLPTFDETGHQATPPRAWVDDIDNQFSWSDTRRRVRECIDLLPDAYRNVLLLRDIEGCDTATTAEILGTAEGNVKVRLHRARQALRALLEPYFSVDGDETE